jgi:hypothetical protein
VIRTPRCVVRTVTVCAAFALVGMAGCKKDDGSSADTTVAATGTPVTESPTTVSQPETTSAPAGMSDEEAAVRDVLDRQWAAYALALNSAEPDYPGLVALLRGEALERLQNVLRGHAAKGLKGRRVGGGPQPHESKVVLVGGDRAVARECVVDDFTMYDSSGRVINDGVSSTLFETVLVREGGSWVITERTQDMTNPGVKLCDDF